MAKLKKGMCKKFSRRVPKAHDVVKPKQFWKFNKRFPAKTKGQQKSATYVSMCKSSGSKHRTTMKKRKNSIIFITNQHGIFWLAETVLNFLCWAVVSGYELSTSKTKESKNRSFNNERRHIQKYSKLSQR